MTYADKAPQTTRFLWQGYRLLQEQRANGTRRTWSYDPESPWTPLAAIEQAGEGPEADIYWLNSDLNGAPLEVTDADGQLRWSGRYDTFGRLLGQTVAGSAQRTGPVYEQPLRYAGQYQDNESGLHYNLFRYYEPEVGRFTTQDPVGLAGGMNLYAYAPNPLSWIDPLGLSKCPQDKEPNWTPHGYKHVAPKNASWKDTINSTKSGPAKYKLGTDIESLERSVYKNGQPVTNGKPWKVQDMGETIGASEGKTSQWMRVEESGGTIHGHPISLKEYLRLTK
ncbi:Hypothetical protein ETA_29970 [Erwinia tasmaniensis Et1/99]|uniref:RHS protein conserved region domain-containing protein n=1 Tax=Erwinia tasmaniensis (strain DSM 17950 / CFBP 7177 / CIP 109463 / NCPPB 4357 / Et1/99) TaxID=465817 RepID=B2VCT5_ERWT9|nr:Hypothetical protein ETA_29970 [Erwinia tasmaniensis Et1/99]